MIGSRGPMVPAFFLACLLSIIWSSPAESKTITIDDSGTQALEPSVSMRWKTASPSRTQPDNTLVGTTTIRVRYTPAWSIVSGPACVGPAKDPWTEVISSGSGQIVIGTTLLPHESDCATSGSNN